MQIYSKFNCKLMVNLPSGGHFNPRQFNPRQFNPRHFNPRYYTVNSIVLAGVKMSNFDTKSGHFNPRHFNARQLNPRHFNPRHFNPRQFNPRHFNPRQFNPPTFQPPYKSRLATPILQRMKFNLLFARALSVESYCLHYVFVRKSKRCVR